MCGPRFEAGAWDSRGASDREGKGIVYSSMRLDTASKAMPIADALYRNLGREIAGDRFPASA
jgi:hypothetical protein